MTKYAFVLLLLASCDGAEPEVDDVADDPADAWSFGGGECRGPFDEPECTERHVDGYVPVVPPSAAECDDHEECAPGEFCGLGRCRIALREWVTLCMEEARIEGRQWREEDRSAPDTWVNIWDLDFYSYDTVTYVSTFAFDSCQPKWRTCVQYPLARAEADVLQVRQTGAGAKYLFSGHLLPDDPLAAQTLGRLTGTGCFEIQGESVRDDADVRVWISVWYP